MTSKEKRQSSNQCSFILFLLFYLLDRLTTSWIQLSIPHTYQAKEKIYITGVVTNWLGIRFPFSVELHFVSNDCLKFVWLFKGNQWIFKHSSFKQQSIRLLQKKRVNPVYVIYTPLQTFHLDQIKYLDGLLVKLPDYLHPLGLHSLRMTEIFQKDVFPYIRFISYAYLLYILINVIRYIYETKENRRRFT